MNTALVFTLWYLFQFGSDPVIVCDRKACVALPSRHHMIADRPDRAAILPNRSSQALTVYQRPEEPVCSVAQCIARQMQLVKRDKQRAVQALCQASLNKSKNRAPQRPVRRRN